MDYVVSMICHASATSLSVVSTHCYTYISRFFVTPHYQQQFYLRPSFIAFFNFSHKRPTFAFVGESGYTSLLLRGSHTRAHTAKQGAFRMGVVSLPSDCFTRFGNPAWPGDRTANFAALGSWSGVLSKNAESLRNSDALMCVAVPRRRGPAGLHSFVAAAHSARFSGISQTGAGSV